MFLVARRSRVAVSLGSRARDPSDRETRVGAVAAEIATPHRRLEVKTEIGVLRRDVDQRRLDASGDGEADVLACASPAGHGTVHGLEIGGWNFRTGLREELGDVAEALPVG